MFFFKIERYVVDTIHVRRGNHFIAGNIANHGYFFFPFVVQIGPASGNKDIRLDAGPVKSANRILSRLGFHLPDCPGSRKIRNHNKTYICGRFNFHHSGSFEKNQVLIFADGATYLNDYYISPGHFAGFFYAPDDFQRNIRHNLHAFAFIL